MYTLYKNILADGTINRMQVEHLEDMLNTPLDVTLSPFTFTRESITDERIPEVIEHILTDRQEGVDMESINTEEFANKVKRLQQLEETLAHREPSLVVVKDIEGHNMKLNLTNDPMEGIIKHFNSESFETFESLNEDFGYFSLECKGEEVYTFNTLFNQLSKEDFKYYTNRYEELKSNHLTFESIEFVKMVNHPNFNIVLSTLERVADYLPEDASSLMLNL